MAWPQQSTPRPMQFQQPYHSYGPYNNYPGTQQGPVNTDASVFYNSDLIRTGLGAYGERLFGSSKDYVQSNISRFLAGQDIYYYFQLNEQYVSNKLKIILCPFLHKGHWTRIAEQVAGGITYKPPRYDINAPDLYIPFMAFATYVVLRCLALGSMGKFTPAIMQSSVSNGIGVWFLEVIILKSMLFTMGGGDVPWLDTLAYSGYSFVGLCLSLATGIFSKYAYYGVLLWSSFCMGVFLVKTLKRILFAEAARSYDRDSSRHHYMLLFVAIVQSTAICKTYTQRADFRAEAMGVPSGAQEIIQFLRARFSGQKMVPFDTDFNSEDQKEAMEWLSEAEAIVQGNVSASAKLEVLNVYLQARTVFVGDGTHITLADLGMFVAIRDSVISLPEEEQEHLPNLFRWVDYVQNKEEVRHVYGLIPIKKPSFFPPNLNILDPVRPAKAEITSNGRNANGDKDNKQVPTKPEVPTQEAPKQAEKENKEKQVKSEKKEKPPAQKKDVDCDVSVLDICVGQIKKVWKHPSADTLYVEEIDVGEPKPRQIVSGLVKYVSEDELLNRRVLVLLNIKPGKVRDVVSAGLVLCASNEDHTKCEPVAPPASAKVGERVKFAGHDGKPEDVLNPKKKQWEKIAPELRTDAEGVANYQGVPFEIGGGLCKSSIVKGLIK